MADASIEEAASLDCSRLAGEAAADTRPVGHALGVLASRDRRRLYAYLCRRFSAAIETGWAFLHGWSRAATPMA